MFFLSKNMRQNIRKTQREIEQQSNIHWHETPTELLKKRNIKLEEVLGEIFYVLSSIKADTEKEDLEKLTERILNLQVATNKQILEINQEKYAKVKEKILNKRKTLGNTINDEISEKINQLNQLRNHIITHENGNIRKEIKRFKVLAKEVCFIAKMLDWAYFYYQEDLNTIEWRLYYINQTNK